MTYDLAKELKDAGFPQDKENNLTLHPPTCTGWEPGNTCTSTDQAVVSTLSELIEACGDDAFGALIRETNLHHNGWLAISKAATLFDLENMEKGIMTLPTNEQRGATPEEAVARLWLALNK